MKSTISFKTIYILLSLTLILSASSCEKEPDIPPQSCCCDSMKPATQEGRGTMSMKINGVPWSNCNPKNENFRTVDVFWEVYPQVNYSNMRFTGNQFLDNDKKKFTINTFYQQLGIYNDIDKYTFIYFHYNTASGLSLHYVTDTTEPYRLNITNFDLESRVVSGEFECTLIKDWGPDEYSDKIKITEGQFDTKF